MESAIAIVVVGSIVFLAHLFAVGFEKTRIPDVLPLVILGVLVGPVFHFVKPEDFGQVGQVFTTLALVIILFHCGLELDLGLLMKSFLPALKLGLINFVVTVGTTVAIGMKVLQLGMVEGCILGCITAACSPPVVIPMLAKLKATEQTRTMLILESTICEVLGIVGTLAFIKAATTSDVQPIAMLGHIIASFIMAAIIGLAAGVAWSKLLRVVRHVEDNIFCTPAFVCIVFGSAELFDYSGPVAALVFGLVLGNLKDLTFLRGISGLRDDGVSFNTQEKTFFAALVFLLKSLFFVYVGLSMQFNSLHLEIVALVLTVWTLLVRLIVVRFSTSKKLSVYDKVLVSFMVPKGLAAAVLASLVLQSGVNGASTIREVAFGVILFSICLVAVLTFLLEKGWLDGLATYVFGKTTPLRPDPALVVTGPFSHAEALDKARKTQATTEINLRTLTQKASDDEKAMSETVAPESVAAERIALENKVSESRTAAADEEKA